MKLMSIALDHGRILRVGQVWQHNTELRAVVIVGLLCHCKGMADAVVVNMNTGRTYHIDADTFAVGSKGWSLLHEHVSRPVMFNLFRRASIASKQQLVQLPLGKAALDHSFFGARS